MTTRYYLRPSGGTEVAWTQARRHLRSFLPHLFPLRPNEEGSIEVKEADMPVLQRYQEGCFLLGLDPGIILEVEG